MNQPTKLKIGLVLDDSLDRSDGVQQYVRSLGGWLSAQGHTVQYLAGESQADGKTVHSLSRNVDVRFNRNRLTIPLPANVQAIKTLLAKETYDILHVQMPYSPLMAGKVINQAAASTVVVGTFHILPFGRLQRQGSKALGLAQKRQFKRLDAICSVSPAAQKFAKSHFGLTSSVIPNMIDTSKWQTPMHPHPGRIVFLGRLVPRKGCMELLQAVKHLCERTDLSHVEVLICGTGPEEKKLQAFCERTDLSQVTFLGYVAENQKADLLASAELAVFPSLGGESFGIVLIEAMAAGAGVVLGGNNLGYQTVLSPSPETLFNPRNTSEFSAKLKDFLGDDKLRSRIHKQQQRDVKQYDTNVVGAQILKMYEAAQLHHKSNVT